MTEMRPHERVAHAVGQYGKAHETIRAHASRLKAEREAGVNAGAKDSALVDKAVAAGVIRAGSTLDPNAPS